MDNLKKFICVFLILVSSWLFGDILYTTDGKIYEGKMVAFKYDTVYFNVYRFGKFYRSNRFPIYKVWKIEFNDPKKENLPAREEMERLLAANASFYWAKFAVDGWDHWDGLFTLPPWYPGITTVHQSISAEVKRGYVLGTRQGLQPRATLFLRDTSGDFQGLSTLDSMRIDITTALSDAEPLLAVVYARIWDNPTDPYQVEALGLPLYPRGSKLRCKYEYLCLQEGIDFAIIDNQDRILLNRRLSTTNRMKKVHANLFDRLSTSPGREYSDMELISAVRAFQDRFALSDVRY